MLRFKIHSAVITTVINVFYLFPIFSHFYPVSFDIRVELTKGKVANMRLGKPKIRWWEFRNQY